MARRLATDGVERGRVEAGAGRVVRVADDQQLRARRQQRAESLDVGPPAAAGLAQRPRADSPGKRLCDPPGLHVVGRHHHHVVGRLEQAPRAAEVGFGSAVGDVDVVGRRARVHRRDGRAEWDRAVGLRVAEREAEQAVAIALLAEQFAERERVDAALREVDLDLVLPDRLHALHLEWHDLHQGLLHDARPRRRSQYMLPPC